MYNTVQYFSIAQIQTENRTWIILTLSDGVLAFLSALQWDARGRYSRGRLIEETVERGREGEREGGEGEREGLRTNAAPLDFRDISLYCIRISIDSSSVLPEDHTSIQKPLATHWKAVFRLLKRKEKVMRVWLSETPQQPFCIFSFSVIQCANTVCDSNFSAFTSVN